MKRTTVVVSIISCWMMFCTVPDNTGPAVDSHLADTANYTTIQWLDSLVDFGTITQGEKIQLKFRFKNTGHKPLFITNVRAGCGCTVPSYTKEAVSPGSEGELTAAFDTNRSMAGDTRKTVVVHTNTRDGSEHSLIFTGHVKEVTDN